MSSISERAWELNSFFLANFLQENNIILLKKTPIFPFFQKNLPKIEKKILKFAMFVHTAQSQDIKGFYKTSTFIAGL
jgi:hypothetical protein